MTLKPEHIVEALNKKTFDEIDPDEVLKHYGYKPEEVRCNGVGIGVWRKEEAFQKLGDIGAFMRFVDHKAKGKSINRQIRRAIRHWETALPFRSGSGLPRRCGHT